MTHYYYYDDPLAAAWMAKYFGMRFQSSPCNFYFANGGPISFFPEKYCIHPDSLYLLKPKIWDIGIDDKNEPCTFNGDSWAIKHPITRDFLSLYTGNRFQIIQRNNILFHWPKGEQ